MNDVQRAILCMLGFTVMWALVEALAGGVLQRYSPYQVVWTRYAVHLLLMLALWGLRDPGRLWRTSRPVYQISRSLLMLVMPASWVTATSLGVPGSTIMWIFWFSPLAIMLLAWWLLQERPPAWLWLAAALACAGAGLTHHFQWPSSAGLLLLPAAMGLSFSLYVVMTRSLRSENMLANLFYTALGVFLALTPAMGWLWRWPTPLDALVMVAVGLLGFVTLWLLDRAAAMAPVSVSAPFSFVQIGLFTVMAVLGGLMPLQSPRRAAAGLALITVASIFIWVRASRLGENVVAVRPVSKES